MAMAKLQDRAAWERQAVELATEAHSTGRARYLGEGVYGEALWHVPSKSSDGVYVVRIWQHTGAAILVERQKQEAGRASGQSEAWRYWLNGGEW